MKVLSLKSDSSNIKQMVSEQLVQPLEKEMSLQSKKEDHTNVRLYVKQYI